MVHASVTYNQATNTFEWAVTNTDEPGVLQITTPKGNIVVLRNYPLASTSDAVLNDLQTLGNIYDKECEIIAKREEERKKALEKKEDVPELLTFGNTKVVRFGDKIYNLADVPLEVVKLFPHSIPFPPPPKPQAEFRHWPHVQTKGRGVPIDLYQQDLTGTLHSGEIKSSESPLKQQAETAKPSVTVDQLAAFFFVGTPIERPHVLIAISNDVIGERPVMMYNPLKGLCLASMSKDKYDMNVIAAIHTDILAYILDNDRHSAGSLPMVATREESAVVSSSGTLSQEPEDV